MDIHDYFDNIIDYPEDIAENTLPYGTLYQYVSYTFLNGFLNYVKPVSIFVLDRYLNEESVQWSDDDKEDFKTKKNIIKQILNNEYDSYHTKLDVFRDDIILLTEISDNKYMYFRFDMDVSDCSIGRFETTDDIEIINNAIIKSLENITYTKLSTSFLKGWLSFM